MDKQQAAERQVWNLHLNDFTEMELVQDKVKEATIAGWEAHEAQCPSDAIAFIKWMREQGWLLQDDGRYQKTTRKSDSTYITWNTVEEVYALFNPSGAAPQDKGNGFLQGYACAVANMCRMNGEADTRTCELFRDGIGKMANLKDAGIDESDLEILNQYFK